MRSASWGTIAKFLCRTVWQTLLRQKKTTILSQRQTFDRSRCVPFNNGVDSLEHLLVHFATSSAGGFCLAPSQFQRRRKATPCQIKQVRHRQRGAHLASWLPKEIVQPRSPAWITTVRLTTIHAKHLMLFIQETPTTDKLIKARGRLPRM